MSPLSLHQRPWPAALLLAACVGLGYGDLALGAGYVHDDIAAVTANPLVRWPPDAGAVFAGRYFGPVSHFDVFPSRPLATLGFAAEAGLGWTSPAARHAVQLGLWWLAALLTWRLVQRWLQAAGQPADRASTVALWAAALATLHPIHTEAVMLVAFRPEVMALVAGLLGCHAMLALRLGGSRSRHVPLLALWTAAALLSKESAVSLLALWALWALSTREARRTLLAPLAAVAVVGALWFGWRLWNYGNLLKIRVPLHDNPLIGSPPILRLWSSLELTARAFGRLLLPVHLAPDYTFDAWPIAKGPTLLAGAGLLTWLALATACGWTWRRLQRHQRGAHDRAGQAATTVGAEGLWLLPVAAVLAWLPVSQLLTPSTVLYGDRLMTVPALLLAIAVALALGRWRARWRWWPATLVLVAALLQGRAVAAHWQTPLALFRYGVAEQPRSLRMQHNLAHTLVVAGQHRQAVAPALRALALDPRDPAVWATAWDATLGAGDCAAAAEVGRHARASAAPAPSARLAAVRWGLQCGAIQEAYAVARQLPPSAQKGRALLDLHVLATAARRDDEAQQWAQRAGDGIDKTPLWQSARAFGLARGGRPAEAVALLHTLAGQPAAAAAATQQARAVAKNLRDPAIRATIAAAWPGLADEATPAASPDRGDQHEEK